MRLIVVSLGSPAATTDIFRHAGVVPFNNVSSSPPPDLFSHVATSEFFGTTYSQSFAAVVQKKENRIMNINIIISNYKGRCVELFHRTDDPVVWIVQSSKKFLWFRMNVSSVWFLDKQQALAFAYTQGEEHRSLQWRTNR